MPHSETTRESARHLEQACHHLASLARALRTAPNEESKHLTAQAIQRALKDVMSAGAAIHPLESMGAVKRNASSEPSANATESLPVSG